MKPRKKKLVSRIKEVNRDGWIIMNQSFCPKDLAIMNGRIEETGFVNLVITRLKEPTEKGYTHEVYLNEWRPDGFVPKPKRRRKRKDILSKEDEVPM